MRNTEFCTEYSVPYQWTTKFWYYNYFDGIVDCWLLAARQSLSSTICPACSLHRRRMILSGVLTMTMVQLNCSPQSCSSEFLGSLLFDGHQLIKWCTVPIHVQLFRRIFLSSLHALWKIRRRLLEGSSNRTAMFSINVIECNCFQDV